MSHWNGLVRQIPHLLLTTKFILPSPVAIEKNTGTGHWTPPKKKKTRQLVGTFLGGHVA